VRARRFARRNHAKRLRDSYSMHMAARPDEAEEEVRGGGGEGGRLEGMSGVIQGLLHRERTFSVKRNM